MMSPYGINERKKLFPQGDATHSTVGHVIDNLFAPVAFPIKSITL